MTYRTFFIILSAVLVVAIGVTWGYLFSVKPEADARTEAHMAELEAAEQADAEASSSEETKEAQTSTYEVPPIKLPEKDPEPIEQEEPTNEVERTGQNTGDVSKPEAPPAPEIPEEQKTDPTSKPEYTEEQIKPNEQETDAPQGGEKKDGKIYVPGFGWIEDHGGGNEGGIVGDPNEEFNWTQVGEM